MQKKFDLEELVTLVPGELSKRLQLTKKQSLLLGYFIMLNGLEESKTNGTFYRSNDDILEDLEGSISEPTLISAVRKFEALKLIERTSGFRNKDVKQASTYKLLENNIFKTNTDMNSNELTLELVKVIRSMQEQINFQNKIIGKILLNQNFSHNFSLEEPLNTDDSSDMGKELLEENFSLNLTSDTDIDKEIDIYNNINNNILNKIENKIKENSNNINNKIEEKENIINNIQEKESDKEEETTEVHDNINSVQVEESKEMNQAELQQYAINKIKEYTKDGYSSEDLEEIRNKVNDELLQLKKDKVITQDSYNYVFGFQVLPTINKLYAELPTYDEKNIPIEDEVFEEVSIKEILDTKTIELPAVEETTTPTATPSSNMEEKFKLALDNFKNDGTKGQEAMDRRALALKKLYQAKQDGSISEPFYKECIHQLCVIASSKGF